jgi:hypothetical protein
VSLTAREAFPDSGFKHSRAVRFASSGYHGIRSDDCGVLPCALRVLLTPAEKHSAGFPAAAWVACRASVCHHAVCELPRSVALAPLATELLVGLATAGRLDSLRFGRAHAMLAWNDGL